MTVFGIPLDALGAVSSIALTGMSTIVAVVALLFSYRQNVGWEPVLLLTDADFKRTDKSGNWKLQFRIEFWNRRKFPVATRSISAALAGETALAHAEGSSERRVYVIGNLVGGKPTQFVTPNSHVEFVLEAELEGQTLDALSGTCQVELTYFDPYRQKECRLERMFRVPA